MRIQVTKLDVMLDQLVFDAHGTDQGGRVEAALALNPGLADRLASADHALALNTVVVLADPVEAATVVSTVKLWD